MTCATAMREGSWYLLVACFDAFDRKVRIRTRSLENGLICYPMGGNVDGVAGDTVILAPPYNASASELDEIVDKLDRSVRQALKEISAA